MRYAIAYAVIGVLGSAAPALAGQIEVADLYDLPPADVYVLGEVHDNPVHHAHQAIAVGAIGAKALVFEMLTEAQALRITPDLLRSEAGLEAALEWNASGWPDFSMYYPIFRAVKAPAIFGGAVERDDARRAVSDGAAAVFGDAAGLFGLDEALDDAEQGVREAGQRVAHCEALPVRLLPGMVEAQRLRDAALARAIVAAFAETGGPVAVITGNGHARTDWGAPRDLARVAPDLRVLSIGQFESMPEGEVPFDLWLVTDPAERKDPCNGFKIR